EKWKSGPASPVRIASPPPVARTAPPERFNPNPLAIEQAEQRKPVGGDYSQRRQFSQGIFQLGRQQTACGGQFVEEEGSMAAKRAVDPLGVAARHLPRTAPLGGKEPTQVGPSEQG